MAFAGKVWRLLVGIKDGLALLFLLLFFMLLFAVLTARPSPGVVRADGALLLELDGVVVEQASAPDPLQMLLSQSVPVREFGARDLTRAIEAAATDDRVNSIVLDLSGFFGGGQVHLQDIGAALEKVRAAEKPVFAYALAYSDDSLMLAAHASEVWLDPMGGAFIAGPGGHRMYYSGLLDQLNIRARVYRVGEFKSAVEPYTRGDMSPEARENASQITTALFEEWKAHVKKARPKADIEQVTTDVEGWIEAADQNFAQAALNAGLVDKLGSWEEFGDRVAKVAGKDDWEEAPGAFASTELEPWLADNLPEQNGQPIGVVTIAGEIVDGPGGSGTVGGQRISDILDEALQKDLSGLVVRVDSPGGSALASEEMRRAILRHKAKDIPVAVSFANIAASGGYWVAAPGDRIFAEPETITGSIGIFSVIPTFENALAEWGVTSDGVRTTPLSGQPDLTGGFTPEVDTLLQAGTEDGYRRFISLVAESRKMTPERVDEIGQGRVWDGGTARQLGLVDQFGGLDDAIAWVASEAELEDGDYHPLFLGGPVDPYASLLQQFGAAQAESQTATFHDLSSMIALRQEQSGAQMVRDLDRLLTTRGAQAYCLECPTLPARATAEQGNWLEGLAKLFAR